LADRVERREKTDVDAVYGCNGLKHEAVERHRHNHCRPLRLPYSFFFFSDHAIVIVTVIIIIEFIVICQDQPATISFRRSRMQICLRCSLAINNVGTCKGVAVSFMTPREDTFISTHKFYRFVRARMILLQNLFPLTQLA